MSLPVDPVYSPSRIKALFNKLHQKGENIAQKYRSIAEVNESFYGGDQWSVVVSTKGKVTVNKNAWFDSEKVPRLSVNLFTGLLMTWSSLITSDRPTVKAVAASDDPIDTYRSAFAQKVIEYLEEEVDSSVKINEAVQLAGLGGTGGLKIVYLKKEDRISWEALSIHDVILDPSSADWREAGWVIFEDHISEDEAEELLEAGGHTDVRVREEPYKNAANEELHGVKRAELWLRPTRKYPQGLYVCFVQGEIVEGELYPYVVNDDSGDPQYLLPLALMTVRRQRGSVYGTTNFTDAVPLQRAFNENVSRLQKIIRTTSSIHLKFPQELAKGFNPAENSLIQFPIAKAAAAKAIEFTNPPQIGTAIFSQRDFLAASMQQVVGLNSSTSGTQAAPLSGRAIENLVELDQNRNADCTRALETMTREAYRLSLKLVSHYFSAPRQAKITNGDMMDVISFAGADVEGVDIRLEPASEIDDMSGQREKIALERVQSGLAQPSAIAQAQNAPKLGQSRAIAEKLLAAFMNGQQITELPGDLDFDAVADVIGKHKADALSKQDLGKWIAVDRFAQEIAQLRNRADELVPAGGAQPQQPPAPGAQPQQQPPGVAA